MLWIAEARILHAPSRLENIIVCYLSLTHVCVQVLHRVLGHETVEEKGYFRREVHECISGLWS